MVKDQHFEMVANDTEGILLEITKDGKLQNIAGAEIKFGAIDSGGKTVLSKVTPTQIKVLGLGQVVINLLPEDTVDLEGTYNYQVQVKDVSGNIKTVTIGRINILKNLV